MRLPHGQEIMTIREQYDLRELKCPELSKLWLSQRDHLNIVEAYKKPPKDQPFLNISSIVWTVQSLVI
ncbi:ATP-binding cassette sub-family A member 10 [Echinococcus multilocularis]|uniref:ATP-binding cassette sub-family A member 10 n=1 Tax=Echinococcus multilocularis TaxID=6211 RepID=A0A0S4MIY5_ECHMU|nr:ATP-binding cassette sub-family A member 10 [Echinococcus multilocularis]